MKKYWYVFSGVVDSVKMTCTAVTGRDKRSLNDEKTHREIEGVFGVRRSKATKEKDNIFTQSGNQIKSVTKASNLRKNKELEVSQGHRPCQRREG